MRRSLSKKEIIKSKAEIDHIFNSGKSYKKFCLRLIAVENNLEFSRIIIIPIKHFGNSVQRNYTRRVYKEIYRLNKQNIKKGFDFAFIVYKGKATTYEETKNNFISLMNQAGFWAVS